MAQPASRSARSVAVEVLERFDPRHGYAATILDRLLDETDQKQRASDLVFGTIRNHLAIDTTIARFSGRPTKRIDRRVLNIARVGAYELLYCPETPEYSIVNEAVGLAKHAATTRQAGFVNAVLREIVRHVVNRDAALSAAAPTRVLIRTPSAGCEFDVDVLPDSPVDYLSACFSLPSWLVAEWVDRLGPEAARGVCLASNRRPSLYVRINPLKTTAAEMLRLFQQNGVEAEVAPPGETGAAGFLRVSGPQSVTALPGFSEGLFTVQDISAARAVGALDPQPGRTILDLCAAPGTKTTQLGELTRDAARIVATDVDAKRLERVRENVMRLGLGSVIITPYERFLEGTSGSFDAVLVDAPCSNTGVLAKRVEARWRITPDSVAKLAKIQRSLLDQAATLLKPSACVCYSTCSVQKTENAEVVRAFLADHAQFKLTHEELTLPSAEGSDHDGAYVALLARSRL